MGEVVEVSEVLVWIRILQNDADPLDPDPQHWNCRPLKILSVALKWAKNWLFVIF